MFHVSEDGIEEATCSGAALQAAGLAPLNSTLVCRSMAEKFPTEAPSAAPPADLFNIWRNDYMLTPQQAQQEVSLAHLFMHRKHVLSCHCCAFMHTGSS
jgi:hypothetical protein